MSLTSGFVAFPSAAVLLQNGAGYMQIAAFVSTLMMVVSLVDDEDTDVPVRDGFPWK